MPSENKQINTESTPAEANTSTSPTQKADSSRTIVIIVGIVIGCLVLCCCLFFACPYLTALPLAFRSETSKTDTKIEVTQTSNIGSYYSSIFCQNKNSVESYNSDTTTKFKSSRKLSEYQNFYKDISSNCSIIKDDDDSWVLSKSFEGDRVQTKVSFDEDQVNGYMIDFVKDGSDYKIERIVETFDY